MRLNPEIFKKIAKQTVYGAFALQIASGCVRNPDSLLSHSTPKVTVEPSVECRRGKPSIRVDFVSTPPENPLIIRMFNPYTRKNELREIYQTEADTQQGTVIFKEGIRYTDRNGSDQIDPFLTGSEVQVSAMRRVIIGSGVNQIVAMSPIVSANIKINCQ